MKEVKDEIARIPERYDAVGPVFHVEGSVITVGQLKALADSHTALLEAAKRALGAIAPGWNNDEEFNGLCAAIEQAEG